jgi:ribosomal RNA assembly protein
MMIKRELAKDPSMADENWERFLPKFKSKSVKRKKKRGKKDRDAEGLPRPKPKKKAYTPFPPTNHQMPSKLDLQIASGEFFQSERERKQRKDEEKRTASAARSAERRAKRAEEFRPVADAKQAKKKREAAAREASTLGVAKGGSTGKAPATAAASGGVDLEALKRKFRSKKRAIDESQGATTEDYIAETASPLKKQKRTAAEIKADKKAKKKAKKAAAIARAKAAAAAATEQ